MPTPAVIAQLLPPDGAVPNHPRWPLLVYPRAVELRGADPARAFEALFDGNGWPAAWRDGVHSFHHYHSTAHEALGVYRGEVTVRLGGERGVDLVARPGDVLVLPAGTGHKKLASTGALGIVGAYPAGQHPDLRTSMTSRASKGITDAIAAVPLPAADPVFGAGGPLFQHWRD